MTGQKKRLSKKQLAVIEDMFNGELDEQSILDRHGISRFIFNKWLTDEDFQAEFSRRIAGCHRQSQFIIARYGPLAAAKLVELTESDKEETRRKACLDIISLPKLTEKNSNVKEQTEQEESTGQLSAQTAAKLLAILAEEKSTGKDVHSD
jgi:23S rRNA G2069 N7-methylase RlmK/C1962 C5-methylase RlmI